MGGSAPSRHPGGPLPAGAARSKLSQPIACMAWSSAARHLGFVTASLAGAQRDAGPARPCAARAWTGSLPHEQQLQLAGLQHSGGLPGGRPEGEFVTSTSLASLPATTRPAWWARSRSWPRPRQSETATPVTGSLSRKCGFATFLDPRGGRPASAGLGALMSQCCLATWLIPGGGRTVSAGLGALRGNALTLKGIMH